MKGKKKNLFLLEFWGAKRRRKRTVHVESGRVNHGDESSAASRSNAECVDGPSHGSGQADPASAQPPAFASEGNFCSTASTSFACQTDLASEDIEFLKNDYQRLLLENAKLTKSLEEANIRATVSPDSYKSDQKVRYLTGLPTFDRLNAVFSFASSCIEAHHRSELTLFQQFVLTLMKLRLNLGYEDLAYRFNVTQSTASKTFIKWIRILFVRLRPLIVWPEREELRKSMPIDFCHHLHRCGCIIDCFEVFL